MSTTTTTPHYLLNLTYRNGETDQLEVTTDSDLEDHMSDYAPAGELPIYVNEGPWDIMKIKVFFIDRSGHRHDQTEAVMQEAYDRHSKAYEAELFAHVLK